MDVSGGSSGLLLLGGIALLLWATRLVRTGVERAFGARLRGAIAALTGSRLRAAATGCAVAGALQSGSAASLLVASLAERGLLALPAALAAVLGADLGSALVVQVLAVDARAVAPLLLVLGYAAFTWGPDARWRNLGRASIGVALVMTALAMVVGATRPLRDDTLVPLLFERLDGAPLPALATVAALTLAVQSSVAVLLLVIAFADAGLLAPATALAMMLGANVGAALVPLVAGWSEGPAFRRIALGNLLVRATAAAVVLPAVPWLAQAGAPLASGGGVATGLQGGALVATGHLLFNAAVCALGLPLCGRLAAVLERTVRSAAAGPDSCLDESALTQPGRALAGAAREVLRLADRVERMLGEVILAFEHDGAARAGEVRRIDDEVDRAQEAIKLYLTRLTRQPLSEADSRRAMDLIQFATHLEHVGDIVDKNLLRLAEKKARLQASFSDEGWSELRSMHDRVVRHARLAVSVFVSRDAQMARELVAAKDAVREAERIAADNHLRRLRDGRLQTLETSSLHLDVLRDLKRIVAHLTDVAYPILEASGQLRASRLS